MLIRGINSKSDLGKRCGSYPTQIAKIVLSPRWFNETQVNQPCDFLILPFPWLNLQTLVVHLVHIPGRLHIAQYIVLQVADGLERVGDVLILLNVSDDISGFGSFGEVDEVSTLDHGWDAVFDESKVGEIDA